MQEPAPADGHVDSLRPLWLHSAPPTASEADVGCGNDSATAAKAATSIGTAFKLIFIAHFLVMLKGWFLVDEKLL
ncbi:MAG: hypothetical protein M3552_06705 [Planctomycetota bacterium]|nr:hypothetical protein [Planctomycetota bacterium]